ncbi:MAG: sulfatase [Verrucomicrobiales bacterium]|nr:sulfatase [Verrucomicrobiales bacterium]|tara:strand:- start:5271 stop:6749 length:1479 start_codon:yes stop_codon:yes gene_type:complete
MNSPFTRRTFLADTGMGMTGMALSAMLFKDGVARAAEVPGSGPHHEPQAKSCIWIFLIGGLSHLESFDPKPELNKYAGKSIEDTPYTDTILNKDRINKILLDPSKQKREVYKQIMPLQTGYQRYGQSGIEVSDWFPNIGTCADDVSIARGMWTIDNNHGAQLTYHTGRKITEGAFPTIGSWVSYGLGTQNRNLPEYVVLGNPSADCCGAAWTHGASYLGPQYAGVRMKVDPKNPLSFVSPADEKFTLRQQRENFNLLGKLNRLAGIEYPNDPKLEARIKSYELAFEMQTAVPEVMDFKTESKSTTGLYGIGESGTDRFGQKCLAARRLVERGVRFVQLFHGYSGSAGAWDSHLNIKKLHSKLAQQVDKPVAGLIKDLRQRGMLDDTLVVLGSEFGRTPGAEDRPDTPKVAGTGRDHHPHGFNVLMAGGGVKKGFVYGATDELGFHAVENRHYVTDLHATVLHQMGLDTRRMEIPGRKRLEMDFGDVMHGILT